MTTTPFTFSAERGGMSEWEEFLRKQICAVFEITEEDLLGRERAEEMRRALAEAERQALVERVEQIRERWLAWL